MTDYAAILRELNQRILENPEARLRIIQDFYAERVKAGDGEGADIVLTMRSIVMASPNDQGLPTWLQRTGVYVGIGTMIFLMIIVILSTINYVVPANTKFVVVSILALGTAFSAASFIGRAAVSGEIPFLNNQKPLTVSATGGFAAFIIVFAMGYWLYIK